MTLEKLSNALWLLTFIFGISSAALGYFVGESDLGALVSIVGCLLLPITTALSFYLGFKALPKGTKRKVKHQQSN